MEPAHHEPELLSQEIDLSTTEISPSLSSHKPATSYAKSLLQRAAQDIGICVLAWEMLGPGNQGVALAANEHSNPLSSADFSPRIEQVQRMPMHAPVEDLSTVVERVLPSVVQVNVVARDEQGELGAPFGSGFVIEYNNAQYIVTNNHVVENAEWVSVQLTDRRSIPAKIMGVDPLTDLAVLKLTTEEKLPPVSYGTPDDLKNGSPVFTIGNPKGYSFSTSFGHITSSEERSSSQIRLPNVNGYFQTDAAINGGNSGGPLFNYRGEVIGINTAKLSSEQIDNMGFVISLFDAAPTIIDLIEHGTATHAFMGAEIVSLTHSTLFRVAPEKVLAGELFPGKGALVIEILPNSPAEQSGLMPGDIITHLDGREVNDDGVLRRTLAQTPPNTQVLLTIERGNEIILLPLILQDRQGRGTDLPLLATTPESTIESLDV